MLRIRHGITGNMYAFSPDKNHVEKVCERIGKSKNSVYFSKKLSVWAIRVKNRRHKGKLKHLIYDDRSKYFKDNDS